MLSQLTFCNYKCFKDEMTLDFVPAGINEQKESLICDAVDGETFLPVISIYGPNGGGKSTVLEVLHFLSAIILNKRLPLKEGDKSVQHSGFIDPYYRFDAAYRNCPCSFDLLFRTNGTTFKYQLGLSHGIITEENLYMKKVGQTDAQIIFERNGEDYYLGEALEGVMADKVKDTMPLLSYIAIYYDIAVIDSVISWFLDIVYINYDSPFFDKKLFMNGNKANKKLFLGMLKEMDIHIDDFRIEEDAGGNITNLFTKYKNRNGDMVELPFEEESSGIRKLFYLLPGLIEGLRKGSFVIADEMDTKLHPKLLRYIIALFTNPAVNKNGAQLLLTSHNMAIMTPEIFRRDEIWFCALNDENSACLYPLITFKRDDYTAIRNDEVYYKRYLEGRYGADPYLKRILDWRNIQ